MVALDIPTPTGLPSSTKGYTSKIPDSIVTDSLFIDFLNIDFSNERLMLCVHLELPTECVYCNSIDKSYRVYTYGRKCQHNIQFSKCSRCNPKCLCIHNNVKYNCKEGCRCKHKRMKISCTICNNQQK